MPSKRPTSVDRTDDRGGPGSAGRRGQGSASTHLVVLGLQRTAGNAATVGMIAARWERGQRASVQRRTLSQAGLNQGLAGPEGTPRRVVGDEAAGGGLPGSVYAAANVEDQADKGAALKAIAQRAGDIGQKLHDWGKPNGTAGAGFGVRAASDTKGSWASPKMFTRQQDLLGKEHVPTVDPFFVRVTARYGPGRTPLELIYQHAAALQGYVESVSDPGNRAATPAATMFHGNKDTKLSADPHRNRRPVYADLHEQTGGANLLGMTAREDKEGLDAYTKLAGEGARWQCVRNNMSRLANDSIFYCADPDAPATHVRGARFDELWVNWAAKFEKRYNIPDADVIDRLKKKRLGTSMEKAVVQGQQHINLEA